MSEIEHNLTSFGGNIKWLPNIFPTIPTLNLITPNETAKKNDSL